MAEQSGVIWGRKMDDWMPEIKVERPPKTLGRIQFRKGDVRYWQMGQEDSPYSAYKNMLENYQETTGSRPTFFVKSVIAFAACGDNKDLVARTLGVPIDSIGPLYERLVAKGYFNDKGAFVFDSTLFNVCEEGIPKAALVAAGVDDATSK